MLGIKQSVLKTRRRYSTHVPIQMLLKSDERIADFRVAAKLGRADATDHD